MLIKSSINEKKPTRAIKSVRDARTGEEDYETKWEYVDELCDRAIEAMDGDRDAMFFNSHLNFSKWNCVQVNCNSIISKLLCKSYNLLFCFF